MDLSSIYHKYSPGLNASCRCTTTSAHLICTGVSGFGFSIHNCRYNVYTIAYMYIIVDVMYIHLYICTGGVCIIVDIMYVQLCIHVKGTRPRQAASCRCTTTSACLTCIYDKYSVSIRIATHLTHVSQCKTSYGANWSNRWTYRAFIINTRPE